MILHCDQPRRREPWRLCGADFAVVPDGSEILRVVRRLSDVRPGYYGIFCRSCRTLYEVAQPTGAPPPESLTEAA